MKDIHFDNRPVRKETCHRCHGSGETVDHYALAASEPFDGAPENTIYALVIGSSDIFTACKEASAVAKKARRPVSFEFNEQVVTVTPKSDPVKVARTWWKKAYNETPEESFKRR